MAETKGPEKVSCVGSEYLDAWPNVVKHPGKRIAVRSEPCEHIPLPSDAVENCGHCGKKAKVNVQVGTMGTRVWAKIEWCDACDWIRTTHETCPYSPEEMKELREKVRKEVAEEARGTEDRPQD